MFTIYRYSLLDLFDGWKIVIKYLQRTSIVNSIDRIKIWFMWSRFISICSRAITIILNFTFMSALKWMMAGYFLWRRSGSSGSVNLSTPIPGRFHAQINLNKTSHIIMLIQIYYRFTCTSNPWHIHRQSTSENTHHDILSWINTNKMWVLEIITCPFILIISKNNLNLIIWFSIWHLNDWVEAEDIFQTFNYVRGWPEKATSI